MSGTKHPMAIITPGQKIPIYCSLTGYLNGDETSVIHQYSQEL